MRTNEICIKVLVVLLLVFNTSNLLSEDASVDQLIKQLESNDLSAQIEAAGEIAELGPLASKAVPALIKAAQSDDLALQHESINALAQIGQEAEEGAKLLIKKLDSPSVIIQYSAMQALRQIGDPNKKDAIPKLNSFLKSSNELIKVSAAWTLASLEPEYDKQNNELLPVLIAGLKSKNSHVQNDSVLGLVQLSKSAMPELVNMLDDSKPDHAKIVCDVLSEMGPSAEKALPKILPLLDSSDPEVCWHAARAVASIGGNGKQAVPKLIQLLSSDSSPVVISAINALGRYGEEAAPAVEDLIPLLSSENPTVQIEAAKTLGAIGPAASAAIPELLKAIENDKNGSVTLYAANALGGIGKKAVPSLTKILDNKDYAPLAASILVEIGPDAREAVPALVKMISESEGDAQLEACMALASIGPDASDAIPQLHQILSEASDDLTKVRMIYTLTKIGDESLKPILQKNVSKPNSEFVKMVSAWALVSMEPENPDYVLLALPELTKMLKSKKPVGRIEGATMLGVIGEQAKSSVPDLANLFNDPNPAVRAAAVSAIAEIGNPPAELLSSAMKLLKDPVLDVRLSAMHLIGKMGQAGKPATMSIQSFLQSQIPPELLVSSWALVQITDDPEILSKAKPNLVKALGHLNPAVRAAIAVCLADHYSSDPEVRKALQNASNDENEDVQKAVKAAIEKLDKK